MHAVKTIVAMNQKGGVGKTTTAANLAAAVAAAGRSAVMLDLDAQCHLSLHFGAEPDDTHHTTYDLLAHQTPLADIVRPVGQRLLLAPASIDLAGVEAELAGVPGREQRLRQELASTPIQADFIIIDCPPSLGLLTLNALSASDEVLIPLQAHFLALQGLGQLLQTVALVQQRINPKLRVAGVVLCMFERITRLANEVVVDLQQFFDAARDQAVPWSDAKVFETVIRRNIKLAECPSHGMSVFDYDPTCNGAKDYAALAEEFLAMQATQDAPPPASPVPCDDPREEPSLDATPSASSPAPAAETPGHTTPDEGASP
ncbi:MAG: ParA family protein [Planctomycetota bacterium]|jgi:chromosome partitioning protein